MDRDFNRCGSPSRKMDPINARRQRRKTRCPPQRSRELMRRPRPHEDLRRQQCPRTAAYLSAHWTQLVSLDGARAPWSYSNRLGNVNEEGHASHLRCASTQDYDRTRATGWLGRNINPETMTSSNPIWGRRRRGRRRGVAEEEWNKRKKETGSSPCRGKA